MWNVNSMEVVLLPGRSLPINTSLVKKNFRNEFKRNNISKNGCRSDYSTKIIFCHYSLCMKENIYMRSSLWKVVVSKLLFRDDFMTIWKLGGVGLDFHLDDDVCSLRIFGFILCFKHLDLCDCCAKSLEKKQTLLTRNLK